MCLTIIYLTGLSFFLWLWFQWKRIKRYWAVRGVPFSPPHPIMGSLTFLQRENPVIFMKKIYQDIKSPYIGIWLFWRPALIINSPEIARRVLVKDSYIFRDRFSASGKTDPVGALTLFLVNDPVWSSIRQRLSVVFTASKLRALQVLTAKKTVDLVKRIEKDMQHGFIKDLRMLCTDFTTDVIGEAAFGISSETVRTGDSTMRKVTRELMSYNLHRGLSWSSIFFLPELVDLLGLSLFPKKTVELLRHIICVIAEQRGGAQRQIKEPKDLLDALLKIRNEALQRGEEISENLILAQATNMLLGGFDTSGSAITWAILELAYNLQIQEKLYNELSQAKLKLGDKDLDATTLSELPYLNAVINETLRKFPPMGWLDRVAATDYVISEKLTIPAGTPVYVNAVGMHWDPDYFPEPEKFDPERFMPENECNIKSYTYLPFGEGPRKCIGMRFGYQTVRYALSAVFLHYKVFPLTSTPKPNDVQVETKGMFLAPLQRIPIKFISRTAQTDLNDYFSGIP